MIKRLLIILHKELNLNEICNAILKVNYGNATKYFTLVIVSIKKNPSR